jgi:iron complex outermembrane receptor protein
VRGTASRGFRAPSLPEITNSTSVSYGNVIDPRDPLTPTQARGVTNLTIANPDLKPERSKNFNLGFVLAPTSRSSIGIDFYHIRTTGVIDTESADSIIANEANDPAKVVRDAQGRILTLYRQYANQGERKVSGFDIDLRHAQPLAAWGKLTFNAQLSRVLKFEQPLALGEPLTDGAGNNWFGSIPKWRGVTSAAWDIGAWTSTLIWNYVDGYDQTTRENERVKPVGTLDLTVAWKATPAATVSFIVQNLTDKRPSWDSSTTFFDFTQADPRGRTAAVRVNYRF